MELFLRNTQKITGRIHDTHYGLNPLIKQSMKSRKFTSGFEKRNTNVLISSLNVGTDSKKSELCPQSPSRFATRKYQYFQSKGISSNALLHSSDVLNIQRSCNFASVRFYSQQNQENQDENNEEQRIETKGLVFHLPNPIEWFKNVWYTFIIQKWLDTSFSSKEFLVGAKQALTYFIRLAVLKDLESMKSVASKDVIDRIQEIFGPLSNEQQQVLEITASDINLAKCSVSSIKYYNEGGFTLSIDVFCIALKTFKSRPLLIQTVFRFGRDYSHDGPGGWMITGIREFHIKELEFPHLKKD